MKTASRVALVLLAAVTASCGGGDGITVTSHVSSVSVAPSSSNIAPGATVQLTATPKDVNGTVLTGLATAWTSSNVAAATVNGGIVTGVAAGVASITATIGGVQGTATVNVAVPTFNISVTGAGTGNGTISSSPTGLFCGVTNGVGGCNAAFNVGTTVTVTATPAAGHTFAGWSGGCSGTGTCTLSSTQAVTATFNAPVATTVALTVTGGGTGNGTVSSNPTGITCTLTAGVSSGTCTANFTSGTSVTLTATGGPTSSFPGWSNACTGTSTCVVTMSQARTATATFTDLCPPISMTFPGTANGSVSAAGCTSNGNPAAVYRFTATGQGGTSFNVTSTFPSRIEVTTDPAGTNIAFISNATPTNVNGEWLLPPGTFLVKVSAVSGTGTFTLTGTASNGATNNGSGCTAGVTPRAFVVGGTYSGQTLATGDCRETDQSFADYFFIRSLKPCTITMTPVGFDAYLSIRDAITAGNPEITHADIAGTGGAETVSLAQCSVAGSGNPIIIEANTFAAGETGSYTLQITITGGGSIVAGSEPPDAGAMLPAVMDTRRLLDSLKLRSKKPPPQ